MSNLLADSYAHCEVIARNSGSSFYRSFSLLGRARRNAMTALYAFARLADDATDDDTSDDMADGNQRRSETGQWCAQDWHRWLNNLSDFRHSQPGFQKNSTDCLAPIGMALFDSVSRFSIPMETLHDLVQGVDNDWQVAVVPSLQKTEPNSLSSIRMKNWQETQAYCHQVASSVGIACLSIWAKSPGDVPSQSMMQSALDCGVAFQMTNILRDIAEDAQRNRIYLPQDELDRFGIDEERWVAMRNKPTVFAINELGDWRGLIRLQIERTKALYSNGWGVANSISLDGQRMFSLMWHSYRRLLSIIEESSESIWQSRATITSLAKLQLVGQHLFTPSFNRLLRTKRSLVVESNSERSVWPSDGPRVAVVGAGLAGINASLHLARHGCRVTLFESKNRIGGRVGSFVDSETGQSVDYCQHVGMNCCTALKQWISDTDQKSHWTEQDALHFVSSQGKKIRVRAWPLPAPFHLAGLLFRWPQLGGLDRIRIGVALLRLMQIKRKELRSSQLAIDWLRAQGQNDRCIQHFWSTILVSALGEQVDRVTLEATHKVLIDGFAEHRTAFHLLVPNRPLSELLDQRVTKSLERFGIDLRLGEIVKEVINHSQGGLKLTTNGNFESTDTMFDAVVIALPWNKVADVLTGEQRTHLAYAKDLQSSPISGVHTWWDRPWLDTPHAILIDRLSQWVFPAPELQVESNSTPRPNQTREYYYQIVISGSRDLPNGDAEGILRMVRKDLAEVFPSAAVATMLRGRVVTDPNAVFSVSVGHESSRLDCDVLSEKRIWIAGDWTATKWPATMEGALRSGCIAAESVLRSFGRDACLLEDRK